MDDSVGRNKTRMYAAAYSGREIDKIATGHKAIRQIALFARRHHLLLANPQTIFGSESDKQK